MTSQELEQAIDRCLDGAMTEHEKKSLFLAMSERPDGLELYCRAASLDANLSRIVHGQLSLSTASQSFANFALSNQRRRTMKMAASVAVAIVVLGLVLMKLFLVEERQPSLAFKTSPDTRFTLTHVGKEEDSPKGLVLENGSRLQLSQGTVELTFHSGVKSVMMAPVDMTLRDDDTLVMEQGSAWFHVPRRAVGFTVKSRELEVVDLGTEFGVLATRDGEDELHVFKGKVRATVNRAQKETDILLAGQARRVSSDGTLTPIPVEEGHFTSQLLKSLPYIHWSFDREIQFGASGSLPAAQKLTSTTHAVRLIQGVHGEAAMLDGKNSHILTDWQGITGQYPRSVACWVKLNPDNPRGWASIVEWGQPREQNYWRLRVVEAEGRAVLRLSLGDEWYDGSADLADGQWHHLAAIDAGAYGTPGAPPVRFFVDGQEDQATRQQASGARYVRDTEEGYPLIIGANHTYPFVPQRQHFEGALDELYIFHGTLSIDSIRSLMLSNNPQTRGNSTLGQLEE